MACDCAADVVKWVTHAINIRDSFNPDGARSLPRRLGYFSFTPEGSQIPIIIERSQDCDSIMANPSTNPYFEYSLPPNPSAPPLSTGANAAAAVTTAAVSATFVAAASHEHHSQTTFLKPAQAHTAARALPACVAHPPTPPPCTPIHPPHMLRAISNAAPHLLELRGSRMRGAARMRSHGWQGTRLLATCRMRLQAYLQRLCPCFLRHLHLLCPIRV
jgi:hypothetical protein